MTVFLACNREKQMGEFSCNPSEYPVTWSALPNTEHCWTTNFLFHAIHVSNLSFLMRKASWIMQVWCFQRRWLKQNIIPWLQPLPALARVALTHLAQSLERHHLPLRGIFQWFHNFLPLAVSTSLSCSSVARTVLSELKRVNGSKLYALFWFLLAVSFTIMQRFPKFSSRDT